MRLILRRWFAMFGQLSGAEPGWLGDMPAGVVNHGLMIMTVGIPDSRGR